MNEMNRLKEDFIPRFNNITLTCDRTSIANTWDESSNISEYQTVLAVGSHITDLKAGDRVKLERTAFPATDVFKDPDTVKKLEILGEETELRRVELMKSKGPKAAKTKKEEELKAEFQEKYSKMQEMAKAYAIPVYIDDAGEEFLWVNDRAIVFRFEA